MPTVKMETMTQPQDQKLKMRGQTPYKSTEQAPIKKPWTITQKSKAKPTQPTTRIQTTMKPPRIPPQTPPPQATRQPQHRRPNPQRSPNPRNSPAVKEATPSARRR